MSVTVHHHPHFVPGYESAGSEKSFITRFFEWAKNEDASHHVGWVGFSVMAMAGVVFPLVMLAILANGASFGLIITAMASLVLVVVGNLAALPTKYTIPFFVLGLLTDAVAVVLSFVIR